MQWSDRAIVLSTRRFGERGAVVRVLSEEHGLYGGLARLAFSAESRAVYQPGNIVAAQWKARLPEHLGNLFCELLVPVAAQVLDEMLSLAALTSLCALLEDTLPEREPQPGLFPLVHGWMTQLLFGGASRPEMLADYVRIEQELLTRSGFGLDTERCAVTGAEEGICLVSPKTGRGVTLEGAGEYASRLLPLPAFLQKSEENSPVSHEEVIDGLSMLGYFLDLHLFSGRGKAMPEARRRFLAQLARRRPHGIDAKERSIGEIAQ